MPPVTLRCAPAAAVLLVLCVLLSSSMPGLPAAAPAMAQIIAASQCNVPLAPRRSSPPIPRAYLPTDGRCIAPRVVVLNCFLFFFPRLTLRGALSRSATCLAFPAWTPSPHPPAPAPAGLPPAVRRPNLSPIPPVVRARFPLHSTARPRSGGVGGVCDGVGRGEPSGVARGEQLQGWRAVAAMRRRGHAHRHVRGVGKRGSWVGGKDGEGRRGEGEVE
ncbi:unnamed protein product [Closterium sp. NIES-53]